MTGSERAAEPLFGDREFCGDEQPHERHEYLRGVRRFDCPGASVVSVEGAAIRAFLESPFETVQAEDGPVVRRRDPAAALAALDTLEAERDGLQEWTDRVSAESVRAATAAEAAEELARHQAKEIDSLTAELDRKDEALRENERLWELVGLAEAHFTAATEEEAELAEAEFDRHRAALSDDSREALSDG